MSIRLNKAIKDLNVGLSTAVDFLAKKGHKVPSDINFKISDEEYLLLAKEFNKDMALKLESERLSQERQSKEKAETVAIEGYQKKQPEKKEEVTKVILSSDLRPQIKEVGHIDLEKKPKPAPKVEEKPTVEKIEKPVAEKTVKAEKTVAETPVAKAEPEEVISPKPEVKPQEKIIEKAAKERKDDED